MQLARMGLHMKQLWLQRPLTSSSRARASAAVCTRVLDSVNKCSASQDLRYAVAPCFSASDVACFACSQVPLDFCRKSGAIESDNKWLLHLGAMQARTCAPVAFTHCEAVAYTRCEVCTAESQFVTLSKGRNYYPRSRDIGA